MPNAAALVPAVTARPQLPNADYRAADQQTPGFAGLIDAGAEPPPPRKPPAPRADNSPRADAASDHQPPPRSTSDSQPAGQDDVAAETSNPPPQKNASGTSQDEPKTDEKPDAKSATGSTADDAAATEIAADAPSVPVPTATVVAIAAPIAVAIATIAAQPDPEPAAPAATVAPVQAVAIQAAPAVANADTTKKAQPAVAVATEDALPDATAEKISATVSTSEPPAAKSRAKPGAASAPATLVNSTASDAHPDVVDAGEVEPNSPVIEHAAELLKSLHPVNDGKTHIPGQPGELEAAQKSVAEAAVAVAADNNPLPPVPTGFGAAAVGVDAAHTINASIRSGAAADAAVPLAGLAVEIATHARDGKSRFEIRLDPPELGRIDVRLDIDRHGNVTSRLLVERADTFDLLRRDFSGLERALNDAGLKTGDNSLQFAMRDQGFAGGQQARSEFTNIARIVVPGDAEAAAGAPRYTLPRLGGVDISV